VVHAKAIPKTKLIRIFFVFIFLLITKLNLFYSHLGHQLYFYMGPERWSFCARMAGGGETGLVTVRTGDLPKGLSRPPLGWGYPQRDQPAALRKNKMLEPHSFSWRPVNMDMTIFIT
jgi:hypothetical protein